MQSDFDNSQVVDGVVIHKEHFATYRADVNRALVAAKLRPNLHRRSRIERRQGDGKRFECRQRNIRVVFEKRIAVAGSVVYRPATSTRFKALEKLENMPKMLSEAVVFKFGQRLPVLFRLQLSNDLVNLVDNRQQGGFCFHKLQSIFFKAVNVRGRIECLRKCAIFVPTRTTQK